MCRHTGGAWPAGGVWCFTGPSAYRATWEMSPVHWPHLSAQVPHRCTGHILQGGAGWPVLQRSETRSLQTVIMWGAALLSPRWQSVQCFFLFHTIYDPNFVLSCAVIYFLASFNVITCWYLHIQHIVLLLALNIYWNIWVMVKHFTVPYMFVEWF